MPFPHRSAGNGVGSPRYGRGSPGGCSHSTWCWTVDHHSAYDSSDWALRDPAVKEFCGHASFPPNYCATPHADRLAMALAWLLLVVGMTFGSVATTSGPTAGGGTHPARRLHPDLLPDADLLLPAGRPVVHPGPGPDVPHRQVRQPASPRRRRHPASSCRRSPASTARPTGACSGWIPLRTTPPAVGCTRSTTTTGPSRTVIRR